MQRLMLIFGLAVWLMAATGCGNQSNLFLPDSAQGKAWYELKERRAQR